MNALQRLEAKCVSTDAGCKELRTHLNVKTGRAYFQVDGKRHIAARWLWEQTHGQLKQGDCVLHRCDNPACVNLEHLFIGSQIENIIEPERLACDRAVNASKATPAYFAPSDHFALEQQQHRMGGAS